MKRFDDSEGAIVIENPLRRKIQIDRDLTSLLGLIEFGLIDRDQNLFNGNASTILGCFDIVGKPFERVTYQSRGEVAMRKITSRNQISSMRIKVTDENDDLIDFNGLPLRFEIEIV